MSLHCLFFAESDSLTVQDTPVQLTSTQPELKPHPSGRPVPEASQIDSHANDQSRAEAPATHADEPAVPFAQPLLADSMSQQQQNAVPKAERHPASEAQLASSPLQDPSNRNGDHPAHADLVDDTAGREGIEAGVASLSAMHASHEAACAGPSKGRNGNNPTEPQDEQAPATAADTSADDAHRPLRMPPDALTVGALAVNCQKAGPDVDHGLVVVLDDADGPSQEDMSVSIGSGPPQPLAQSGGATSAPAPAPAAAASGNFNSKFIKAEASKATAIPHAEPDKRPPAQTSAGMPFRSKAAEPDKLSQGPMGQRPIEPKSRDAPTAAAVPEGVDVHRSEQQSSASAPVSLPSTKLMGSTQLEKPSTSAAAPNATSNVLWGRKSGHAYQALAKTDLHNQATSTSQPAPEQHMLSLGSNAPSDKGSKHESSPQHVSAAHLRSARQATGAPRHEASQPGLSTKAGPAQANSAQPAARAVAEAARFQDESSAEPGASHGRRPGMPSGAQRAGAAPGQHSDEPPHQSQDESSTGTAEDRRQAVHADMRTAVSDAEDSEPASADEGGSEVEAVQRPGPEAAKGGGNLASNIASQLRSFLTLGASKGEAAPAAGKKPVKVQQSS